MNDLSLPTALIAAKLANASGELLQASFGIEDTASAQKREPDDLAAAAADHADLLAYSTSEILRISREVTQSAGSTEITDITEMQDFLTRSPALHAEALALAVREMLRISGGGSYWHSDLENFIEILAGALHFALGRHIQYCEDPRFPDELGSARRLRSAIEELL